MPFDPMDFRHSDRLHKLVSRHTRRGTPLHEAWADVVKSAAPAIGPAVARAARDLPITEGLVTCTVEYAALLFRDNPGPARRLNGLWFGLARLVVSRRPGDTVVTPYISGSNRYDPRDEDWPCDPHWMPDDRWAHNRPMTLLSRLRAAHPPRQWYIDVCLIEPLHRLYVAHFARACPPHILLGKARARAVACGFDSGDLHTIGTVTAKGFTPSRAR